MPVVALFVAILFYSIFLNKNVQVIIFSENQRLRNPICVNIKKGNIKNYSLNLSLIYNDENVALKTLVCNLQQVLKKKESLIHS